MRRPVITQVAAALIGSILMLLALRAGWIGDVLGVALPLAALGSFACFVTVMLTAREWCLLPAVATLLCAFLVVSPRFPHDDGRPVDGLRITAANIRYDNPDIDAVVTDLLDTRPDVLVVSELTPQANALLARAFPYSMVTDDLLASAPYGQGVYSRFPLARLSTDGLYEQSLRVVVAHSTPFTLYSTHLPRPTLDPTPGRGLVSFAAHRQDVFDLDSAVDSESGPTVIAGDLNLSDRTGGYRRLSSGRGDATRSGWAASTFAGSALWSLAMLRIDHILVPDDWCSSGGSTFRMSGSDHRGVMAVIGVCQ